MKCYHRVQHTLSTTYTEYGIHWVQHLVGSHTPRTASSQDWLSLAPSQSVSSERGTGSTQFSTFARLRVNQWMESQLPSHLPPDLPSPDRPPLITPPITINHSLQVHLQTRSMMGSKFISELQDLGLQVNLQTRSITASTCISELHNLGLQVHLQTCSTTASKCIPEFN